jgi:hypothetical protein
VLENINCYQSRVGNSGKQYVLRFLVNETVQPPVVIHRLLYEQEQKISENIGGHIFCSTFMRSAMSTRSHESEAPSGVETRLRRLLGNAGFWADWTAPIALIVLSVIFTLRSPVFLSEQNIRGMLADSSLIIVVALGLTFVVAIGGIDRRTVANGKC